MSAVANKPRMVLVTDPIEKAAMVAAWHDDTLACPSWVQSANGELMADADELRAWREQRLRGSQADTEGKST